MLIVPPGKDVVAFENRNVPAPVLFIVAAPLFRYAFTTRPGDPPVPAAILKFTTEVLLNKLTNPENVFEDPPFVVKVIPLPDVPLPLIVLPAKLAVPPPVASKTKLVLPINGPAPLMLKVDAPLMLTVGLTQLGYEVVKLYAKVAPPETVVLPV